VTTELGIPVHSGWYSDEFGWVLRRVGLPRITLHDSWHSTLTLKEPAAVPISLLSRWLGHYGAAFTQKPTSTHGSTICARTQPPRPGSTRSFRKRARSSFLAAARAVSHEA
jgi:hypothetical protein